MRGLAALGPPQATDSKRHDVEAAKLTCQPWAIWQAA